MEKKNFNSQDFTHERNTLSREVLPDANRKITLEIGDSKSDEFIPQAKIMHWNNETNFSIRRDNGARAFIEVDGKIVAQGATEDVVIYELEANETNPDGGLEIEIHLPVKPTTNVFNFSLQHKELDFFYQPALTVKEIARGASRQENVVGSYAVYHKTNKNNIVGVMEYRTGKAFHIYRPEAIDANGVRSWCELDITEGELIVTVPQNFLDTAVYPVVVDPTFGFTSQGASDGQFVFTPNSGGGVYDATAGTIESISSYIRASFSTGGVRFALYDNVVAYVSADYLERTQEVTVSSSTYSLITFDFLTNQTVATDTYALICKGVASAEFAIAYDTAGGSPLISDFNTASYPTFDDPLTAFADYNTATWKFSIYATYTVASFDIVVFDTVTIAEDLALIRTVEISIFDAVAIAEDVATVVETADFTASLVDTVAIAEDAALVNTADLSVVDTVAIAEDSALIRTVEISVFDTVAIAEDSALIRTVEISVFDTVAITEDAVTVVETADFTASLFDTVTIAEDSALIRTVEISVFDTVAIAEDAALVNTADLSVVDTVAIAEETTFSGDSFVSVFDTVTVTELVNFGGALTLEVFDAIVVYEDTQLLLVIDTLLTSEVDVVGISENVTLETSIDATPALSDQLSVTENIEVALTFLIDLFDSVSITESLQLAQEINATVFDTVAIAEDSIQELNQFVAVSDEVAIAENINFGVASLEASVLDTVTVAESFLTELVYFLATSSSLVVTEEVTTENNTNTSIFTSVGITEEISVNQGFNLDVFDSLSTNEFLAFFLQAEFDLFLFESILTVENTTTETNTTVNVLDLLNLTENISTNQFFVTGLMIFDSITMADVVTGTETIRFSPEPQKYRPRGVGEKQVKENHGGYSKPFRSTGSVTSR